MAKTNKHKAPPRKPKIISAKDAYQNGDLANAPNIKMSDYFKSMLHSVKQGKVIAQSIIEKQAEMAMEGDSKAAEFLFDRAYGKPTQSIHVETPPQVIIEHGVISIDEARER